MSITKKLLTLALILLNVFAALVMKAENVAGHNQAIVASSPSIIHGPAAVCTSQNGVVYTTDTVPGAVSYDWTVPANATIVSGQGTDSIVVNFGGTLGDICVTVSDANGPAPANCLTTYYAPSKPAAPDTIYGPINTVCPGQIVTYSIDEDSIAQDYTWLIPSHMSIISGANTNTIQVLVDTGFVWGYLRAAKSNCRGISAQYVIAVYSAPTKPGSVTGAVVGACANGTYQYSFAPVPGATSYTWYAPQGCIVTSPVSSGNPLTTSVTTVDITFPANFNYGSLYITSNSGCNSSEMRELKIRSLPMKPGAIRGPFYGVCEQTGVLYYVDSVAGATSYNWNFNSNLVVVHGNGNDSITVDYLPGFDHATLCVTADDACGSSVARCGVVYARPQIAQQIQGPTGACNSIPAVSIAYYEIDTIFGTASYLWTVPPGATITAGQGTTHITVDYMGASSGNVTVSSENNCGTSPARSLSIVVNPCRINDRNEVVMNTASMTVYPNPATDEFTVSFQTELTSEYVVRILDITGREVMMRKHNATNGVNNEIFNVSDLPRGIYLAELSLNGNKQFTKVVVK
jgi:hypothetical protein